LTWQDERLKKNYRFIPKCAWATCIIDLVVFRPFEHILANELQLPDAGDRFLSKLFPGLSSPTKSKDISASLYRDTGKVLNKGVGVKSWRQVTVAFSAAHRNPEAVATHHINPDNEIRGHSNQVAETHYANHPTNPAGISYDKLRSHLQAAHWWYDLTGIVILFARLKPFTNFDSQASKVEKSHSPGPGP
jgi:hypothetical protein